MRDPHVEWLLYRMEIAATTLFENPPTVEQETPDFCLILRNAEARFHMKQHHATVDEAQISARLPFKPRSIARSPRAKPMI